MFIKEKQCPGNGKIEKLFQIFIKTAESFLALEKLDKFLNLIYEWLEFSQKYQNLWKSEAQISTEEYFQYRAIDVAAPMQFYFFEIDSGIEVTDELISNENWVGLTKNGAINLFIINDLCSLKREVKSGFGKCNYVYIKMKENNLSAQQAVNQLIVESKNAQDMAIYHGQKLKKDKLLKKFKGLNDYVDGLIATMAGNHYWSTICKRYNKMQG